MINVKKIPAIWYIYWSFSDDKPGTNFESVKHKSLKEARYEEACNRLAVEAVKRGCTDNVTVMIIDILHHSQQDSVTNTALT